MELQSHWGCQETVKCSDLQGQQLNVSLAYQASKDIHTCDACGDWSVMEVHLNSCNKVLHKVNLPMEWEIGNIEGGGMLEYIVDTYHYVQNTYNRMKALHQLVMICAVICAGLLPMIFCPKIADYPSNKASYGEFMRNLEWVEWDQKGAQHAGWFITMVSGFIICLFKASGFQSVKWNKDIILLNLDWIKERHAEVVRLMRTGGKYGGFDAVQYLAGMNAARILTNHYVTNDNLPMLLMAFP
ncbi:hypothetical protein BKA83DRAFT_4131307 [Pisolithus microcarpus]|nr:hypothetical protein BKA83DRAFT_4131307 [Pisolithus microcarpus]